ncbi:ankyrin repeat-containing protein BDA1 [Quercus suber]|uniref:ankyrin repeat-containing protein BDA1 n=1 Tax=Quercus suber TaxID=58331 RepID=UPI0032DFAE26
MEMMRLKPSFARKPDLNGYSPIHLAVQGRHTQMVRRLLQVDGDLVRVKGKEGRTPLHDVAAEAATEQQLDLLFKFLSDCPNSIEDVTIQNQTALHIALENNNLGAFKLLVGWLRENKSENAREILNRQDEEDNTVLHMAVSKNQTECVRELLNCGVLEGHIANGMLQEQEQVNIEIRNMLSYAEALSCLCLPKVITCYEYCYIRRLIVFFYERSGIFRKPVSSFKRSQIFRVIDFVFERLRIFRKTIVERARISNDDRNALLVVAALLITITYQVVLSPPGGLWQDTKYFGETSTSSNAKAPVDKISNENIRGRIEHYAGTAIAQQTYGNFENVATINYITFTLSAIITFLLLPSGYISALFKMALVQLWVSYYYSLAVICESGLVLRYCIISTGLCFVLVLFAFFGRQFCGVRIKSLNLDWIFYIVYAYVMWWIINFI